ncbi:MAG: rhomboid family intramembrane serine protease [Fimbriimonadaceae bacterium]|nr:rhomboid family intramembrane serine protease [Fimbriimonadaceae bacterium]
MPDRSQTPMVSLALILMNLAGAVAAIIDPGIAFRFGFSPAEPSFMTAFLGLFLHLNAWHLMGNLIFLSAVGPLLEFSVGRWKVGVVYLVGGLAGVAGHWAFNLGRPEPLIGASGAVAALIAFASVRHISLRVPIAPKVGAPAWAIALAWLGLQIVGGIWHLGVEGVSEAYWAHVAGFFAGLVLAGVLGAAKQAQVELGHEVLDRMNDRGPSAALHSAERHLARHPEDLRAWRQKIDAQKDLHDDDGAADSLLRLIDLAPRAQLPTLYRELDAVKGLRRMSALRLARLADEWDAEDPILARLFLESLVERPDAETQRPDALVHLAALLQGTDVGRAADLVRELEQKYPGHGAVALARAKGLIR